MVRIYCRKHRERMLIFDNKSPIRAEEKPQEKAEYEHYEQYHIDEPYQGPKDSYIRFIETYYEEEE